MEARMPPLLLIKRSAGTLRFLTIPNWRSGGNLVWRWAARPR